MNIRNVGIAILLMVAVLIVALIILLPQNGEVQPSENITSHFTVKEMGRAGDYGYVVFDNSGEKNLTLIAYKTHPEKKIQVLNETERIGSARFNDFVNQLKSLEHYGLSIDVNQVKVLRGGTVIVPTGAMPSYILDDLAYNASNTTVIYFGKTDLVIKNGVKQEDWYSPLDEGQKKRLVLINSTLDDFLAENNSFQEYVLENAWAAENKESYTIADQGVGTITFPINDSNYFRVLWQSGDRGGIIDSPDLPPGQANADSTPASMFPWENATMTFNLNKTNGTAILTALKDGKEEYVWELDRVRDENYFYEYFPKENSKPPKPGDYVLRITDNSGIIGGGVIHVKELGVSYLGSRSYNYLFNITVDGKPITNQDANVSLGNSSMARVYFVSDGILTVPAELAQGINIFHIRILGTNIPVEVNYAAESLFDFYLKYGSIGLILILVVFFWARMSKSPVYVLRIGETAGEIRRDLRLPVASALAAFKSVRKDLGIGNNPITAHEFSIALKRYVTEGADVTEGNVEEIMQRLVSKGFLESHRQYYQLKGEGDVRKNSIMRRVRDRLIEAGMSFKIRGKKFVTESSEIGFFREKFAKNAIVVVEDQQELDSIFMSLSQKELAALQVKMANGIIKFVTVDRLDDVL